MQTNRTADICERVSEVLPRIYDLPSPFQVSYLKYSENITLCVESQAKKQILRIDRAGYHPREELESELLWMREVRRDTDLQIADVLPGKDGALLQRIPFAASDGGCYCTMFSFVPGRQLRNLEGEALLKVVRRLGTISAILHNQVLQSPTAETLPRFSWDYEALMGENARWGCWKCAEQLTQEQREVFGRAEQIIRVRLDRYGKGRDRYGLIHSDLNINNILVDGDAIGVLDFDDCGYGWFLYDMSTTLLEYAYGLDQLVQAWVEGYQQLRKLSQADLDEISTFLVMRKLVRMGWIQTHADNDTVKRVTGAYYRETEALARMYLESPTGVCTLPGEVRICDR